MKKIHTIHLPQEEKVILNQIISRGIEQARVITRSRVLLLADRGKTDPEIYEHLSLSTKTPYEIRKRYAHGGLKFALYDRPRPGQPRRFNGAQEAEIVAIACSMAPKGYAHWTLDLLTKEAQGRGITIGRTAVWKVLLHSNLKPWRKKNVVHSGTYTGIHKAHV
jgi:putative transposase